MDFSYMSTFNKVMFWGLLAIGSFLLILAAQGHNTGMNIAVGLFDYFAAYIQTVKW